MKTRHLTAALPAALAAALLLAALPVRDARAQNATDTKIRLMAEALRARDAGDLAGAQRALAQLAALAPEDRAVQRLRSEVETQAVAQQSDNARRVAAEKAAAARGAQAMVDVRIPETAPAAATPAPAGPGPEQEAEAIARAEAARQTEVISAGRQQLADVREQVRSGRYDEACFSFSLRSSLACLTSGSVAAFSQASAFSQVAGYLVNSGFRLGSLR